MSDQIADTKDQLQLKSNNKVVTQQSTQIPSSQQDVNLKDLSGPNISNDQIVETPTDQVIRLTNSNMDLRKKVEDLESKLDAAYKTITFKDDELLKAHQSMILHSEGSSDMVDPVDHNRQMVNVWIKTELDKLHYRPGMKEKADKLLDIYPLW